MASGVVLAAGWGRRLSKVPSSLPKPLLRFKRYSLLNMQVKALRKLGITDVFIVANPLWVERIREEVGTEGFRIRVLPNYWNFLENGYSMFLGIKYALSIDEVAVVTVVDHIYEENVLKGVLDAVDRGRVVVAGDADPKYVDIDESTKILESLGKLLFGKGLRRWTWVDMGVFAFTKESLKDVRECVGVNPSISEIMTCLSGRGVVQVREFSGVKWCDVDVIDDYLSLIFGRRKEVLEEMLKWVN